MLTFYSSISTVLTHAFDSGCLDVDFFTMAVGVTSVKDHYLLIKPEVKGMRDVPAPDQLQICECVEHK